MQPNLHITNSQKGLESDFPLTAEEILIGRSPENGLVLPNDEVSRRHATLRLQDDSYLLIDLDSANGTMVNGEQIKEKTLVHGDTITMGPYSMVYHQGLRPTLRYEDRKLGDSLVIRTPDQIFPGPSEAPPVSSASSPEALLGEIET